MEALATRGVPTMLCVDPPSEETMRQYSHVRAIGVAGNSRTMSPHEMENALPGVFRALARLRPRILHYKVCSTFDSSPEIGSIGRAIEIGQRVIKSRFVPLVVGVPTLQRFCVFGNLFARSGLASVPFRLDRHPTMRSHPVTPMTESDLRLHLARQTSIPIELVDVLALEAGYDAALHELNRVTANAGRPVLFDALTEAHLTTIGRLIWETQSQEQAPLLVAGSSGIEYALAQHWRSIGVVANSEETPPKPQPADRVLVISGSCSPVTARQIGWSLEHGFAEVALDVTRWRQAPPLAADIAAWAGRIVRLLANGQSVIAHTGGAASDRHFASAEPGAGTRSKSALPIGVILGRIVREVLKARAVRRLAVVGGDTSGQVARELGISALEYAGSLDPGAPLCHVRGRDPIVDGLEISFKGGQVGYDDFFGTLLRGSADR